MGDLGRRLKRLEERAGLKCPERHQEDEKERWLAGARVKRNHNRDRSAWSVQDLIRHFRGLGILAEMSTEELLARIRNWRPPPAEDSVIEREVARAVYEQWEGTENKVCDPAWREAFEVADELRERYAAVPDEVLARWAMMHRDLEERDALAEEEEKISEEGRKYGLTEKLLMKAVGPDAGVMPNEERLRRLLEILGDLYYGERGFYVAQHVNRLAKERGRRDG